MVSPSNPTRRRRGKEPMDHDAAEFDSYRFQLEEEKFPEIPQQIELRGWKRLGKPRKKVEQALVREFYTNAQVNPNEAENHVRFQTFVRGVEVNFNMESIKPVLRLGERMGTEMNFRRRMTPTHQELGTVIVDLCVQGVAWELGDTNAPLYLKRRDLHPIPRG
ncbi:hypothetical protein PIB30_052144 [Stylosanthes scabra]|uniref:Putative plant transposon protein domain-containing protein n=1 Tax=Stylosanthes scabra TaxID=79078 RepID=A0ABU6YGD4_9FABA|nr:hypothetical protein [Stylosanthes scabra]